MKVLQNEAEVRAAVFATGYGEIHYVATPELAGFGESFAHQHRQGMGQKFIVQSCVEVEPTVFTRQTQNGSGSISLVLTNNHPGVEGNGRRKTIAPVERKFKVYVGDRA